jgi:hypothetical protein
VLNPNGAGGFELGNTFADNGWINSATSEVNRWVLGSRPTGIIGNRAAYLSNDFNAANPATTITAGTAITTHLYTTISLPASDSSILISFKWKANYTSSGTALLRVVIDSAITNVPTSGVASQGAVVYNAVTGTSDVWTVVQATVSPMFAGKTVRLVFSSSTPASFTNNATITGPVVDSIGIVTRANRLTFISTNSGGNWGTPTTWINNAIPTAYDNVVIPQGSSVAFQDNVQHFCNDLTINGTLTAASTANNTFNVLGNLSINNTGTYTVPTTSAYAYNIAGNLNIAAGASISWQRVTLTFNGNTAQVFNFDNANQFVGQYIGAVVCNNNAGLTVNANTGVLELLLRIGATRGVLTHNNVLRLNNTLVSGFNTVTIAVVDGSFASRVPVATNASINLLYSQVTATSPVSVVAGSRNELPLDRTVTSLQIGSVNVNLQVNDSLRVSGTTFCLTLFGRVDVADNAALVFTNPAATFNVANNGLVKGNIIRALNGNNVASYNFPVGWGNTRRAVTLRRITADNARVLIATKAYVNGTNGSGIAALANQFVWEIRTLSGTLTSVDSIAFEYDVAAEGFTSSDSLNRRIATSATINGTYNAVPAGASTATPALLVTARGNYNNNAFYAVGLTQGGFLKTWTGAAGTYNWFDAANWSGNTVPSCNDVVTISEPFRTIELGSTPVQCAGLILGLNTSINIGNAQTLNIGCNMPTGGNALLDIIGRLTVADGATLAVNGGILLRNTGFLSQTGGNILLDPVGNTDTLKVNVLQLGESVTNLTNLLSLQGGTITFIDPNGLNAINYLGNTTIDASQNHTIKFGTTTSTQRDASLNGYLINLQASGLNAALKLGNVAIDGGNVPGRWFIGGSIFANGNLTVAPNADLRTSSVIVVRKNFTNQGRYFSRAQLAFGDFNPSNNSIVASSDNSVFTTNSNIYANYPSFAPDVPGNGYSVGDVLTLFDGGACAQPPTFVVRNVNASGGILTLSVVDPGSCLSNLTSPYFFTGGSGSGCLINTILQTNNGIAKVADVNSLAVANNLTINQSLTVLNTLQLFTNAVVNTGNNRLTLGSTDGTPITGSLAVATNARINGTFRRAFSTNTFTENDTRGLFPIGTATQNQYVAINYATAPTGFGYISASFVAANPGINGNLPTENTVTISNLNTEGYWNIQSEGTLAGTPNIRLIPTGFANLADNVAENRIVQRTDASAVWQFTGTHVTGTSADTLRRTAITLGGQYAIGRVASTLPLFVQQFHGVATHQGNLLSWKAANEVDIAYYELEASTNTQQFESVHQQAAKQVQYQFLHQRVAPVMYYRLKLVGKNGKVAYSGIIQLKQSNLTVNIVATPTITTDKLQLQITSPKAVSGTWYMINMQGTRFIQQPFTTVAGTVQWPVSVSHLPQGTYYITLQTAEGSYTTRFIKQ